jgi:hypothetical protein
VQRLMERKPFALVAESFRVKESSRPMDYMISRRQEKWI